MCIRGEVFRKEDRTHAQIIREPSHVAPAVDLFVELMAERGADVLETRKRKLPVGVECDRMGVIVV